MNQQGFFPPEILLQIFSYLNVEDLRRCKCLCRKFIQEFKELDLLILHFDRPIGPTGYLRIEEDSSTRPVKISVDKESGNLLLCYHDRVEILSQNGKHIYDFRPTYNFRPYCVYASHSRILISLSKKNMDPGQAFETYFYHTFGWTRNVMLPILPGKKKEHCCYKSLG